MAVAIGLLLGAAPVRAQQVDLADYDYENLQFRGIGMDMGRMWPSNLEVTTPVRLRIDLGYLGPGVRIVPSIAWWQSDVEEGEISAFEEQLEESNGLPPGSVELGEIELSDLALQLDAHFVWTTPIDLLVYLGAGAGLHMLNAQGEDIDDTFIEDLFDSVLPGVTALAGLEYALVDRVRVYGEAHFTIVSDILSPGLRVGAAIMLPTRVQGED
ncbi:MAG TPA: hypothetical protein VF039_14985 [Longimicrobiales bacterium]